MSNEEQIQEIKTIFVSAMKRCNSALTEKLLEKYQTQALAYEKVLKILCDAKEIEDLKKECNF